MQQEMGLAYGLKLTDAGIPDPIKLYKYMYGPLSKVANNTHQIVNTSDRTPKTNKEDSLPAESPIIKKKTRWFGPDVPKTEKFAQMAATLNSTSIN